MIIIKLLLLLQINSRMGCSIEIRVIIKWLQLADFFVVLSSGRHR